MSEAPDLDAMTDEEELHKLLSKTDDFDTRKKIRSRLKALREEQSAAYEKEKAERNKNTVSAMQLKQQQAEKTRDLKLKALEERAIDKRNKPMDEREAHIRKKHADADVEKQRTIKSINDRANNIRDITAGGDELKKNAENKAKEAVAKKNEDKLEETLTNSSTTDKGDDGGKRTTNTTKNKKIIKAKSEMEDKNTLSEGSKVSIQRSPSAIKELMLQWCKQCTAGYEHVDIKNFSSSWNDGMAFCALIHHFYPNAFDYSKLQPKYRKGNFKLGFTVSEKLGGVAPLLDIEDMVRMKNPDWKCVFTYVQQFYRRFRNWDEEQEEIRLKKEKEDEANKENDDKNVEDNDTENNNEKVSSAEKEDADES